MSSDYEYEDEGYEDEDEDEDYGGEDFQDEYSQEDHSQGDHSQEERSQKEHTQEDYNDDDLSDATQDDDDSDDLSNATQDDDDNDDLSDATQDDDRDASYNNMNVDTDGSYSTVTDKPTRKADDMNSPSMEAGAETDTISEHGPNRTPPLSSSSPSPSDSLHKTLQSLLTALTKLRTVRGPLVNGHTFFLFLELLNFRDANIASGVESTNSDVELFLDFLLHLLRDGSLQIGSYTRDVTTKARKLVFKLASKTHVLPRSLFITDIEKDPHAIAVGGFGRVFKGKYGGQLVALKMLYQSRRAGESIEKNLYTEALTWRSLSHRYIYAKISLTLDQKL
ncbi:hypothetical protein AX14_010792 [Amanita brunnescens Koide BX004]|nr:hypothetical protein AX14_010792 [Amanita brunnescens Koide BX004]